MKNSIALSPFTMPAALAAADSILGAPVWFGEPDNHEQTAWLRSFHRRAGIAAAMPEIHRNATDSADQHVAWLKSEGWEAQVTGGTSTDIFLAATLNIVAKWSEVGRAYEDRVVHRVLLKKGVYTSRHGRSEHPVVGVATQHPSFTFYFQQADSPLGRGELAELALAIASRSADEAVHLDFPMVDMQVRDEAKYMLGLRAGPNVVTQAAEQLRLELNEVGGRASAAAEVAVTRSMGPRTIRIDGPFVVAIARNGVPDADKVVFAAYVDRDAWRRPGAGRI